MTSKSSSAIFLRRVGVGEKKELTQIDLGSGNAHVTAAFAPRVKRCGITDAAMRRLMIFLFEPQAQTAIELIERIDFAKATSFCFSLTSL